MGCASLSDPPALSSLGCCLLGIASHHLWIHVTDGALSRSSPGIPGGRRTASVCPIPPWSREELGKRSGIERFFGRVFLLFHLQRPPLSGWSTLVRQVCLTDTATIIVALAAQQAGRPDLIRSPKRVLAHV